MFPAGEEMDYLERELFAFIGYVESDPAKEFSGDRVGVLRLPFILLTHQILRLLATT